MVLRALAGAEMALADLGMPIELGSGVAAAAGAIRRGEAGDPCLPAPRRRA